MHYSLLIYPKLIPLWGVLDNRPTNAHPLFPNFFSTEHGGPYLQAQLYWADQTMGSLYHIMRK